MRHCAILDIGSTKVVCMIVSAEPDGAMIVHGTGIREYSGYRMGEIPNKRELAKAISGAVDAAERASKLRVKEVSVGVPAPFMEVVSSPGSVEILSRSGRVTASDVELLIDSSFGFEAPAGCSLIHSTPVSFTADRTPVKGSPVGLPCSTLSADVSHCYVDEDFTRAVNYGLDSLGITADSFVSAGLAAACFTVPEDIRAESVFIVDCGGTHTDVTLLKGNAVVDCASIPIGGKHFTNDLCFGLRLPEGVAEDLKRRYVFSLDYGDSCERVRIPGEGIFDIEHSFIQLILESRADELCDLLIEKLDPMAERSTPVWLVGSGLALMRGASEFVGERIGRNVAVSMPKVSRNSSLSFAAGLGLADFALFRTGRSSAIKKTERYLRRAFDWRT
ncbi:MAG: rod shape-determining protein [Clostridia bacterium]|nr:rod shape-determining protein [Clostridia bacterium]